MVTDGLGNPLRFLLSSGNRNDICLAREMLEPFELTGKMILADRGYDSDLFVRWIKERGGIPVILSRNSARHPRKTGVTPKFCVKSNECRNRANLYVGGSGLTVCRLCLQHNAGGDGCQGRRSRSFDP